MKAKIITAKGAKVLILNRESAQSCALFMEYMADNVVACAISKNDYDYTFEITSGAIDLTAACIYINANL